MIYFLRHGEDDERFIGGWSDVDLIDRGIDQVKESVSILKDLPIKKIISSDIKRARTTAQIVSDALNIPVTYSDKLRELDKGLLTGLPKEEAMKKYPYYMGEIKVDDRFPEGESLVDLYHRIEALLSEIEGWDEVLIVTHRGVINMVYFLTLGKELDYDKKQFGVTHASIHEYDPEKKLIKKIGR